jgi:predicted RNA binding protein YcfA (HicA-like mRNA interferase family)
MRSRLPVVSGRQAIAAFERDGWMVARQESSHVTMKKRGCRFLLTVPRAKELDTGTLRRLIRDAGLSVEEFGALLPG